MKYRVRWQIRNSGGSRWIIEEARSGFDTIAEAKKMAALDQKRCINTDLNMIEQRMRYIEIINALGEANVIKIQAPAVRRTPIFSDGAVSTDESSIDWV